MLAWGTAHEQVARDAGLLQEKSSIVSISLDSVNARLIIENRLAIHIYPA
jgi:hypothetical protein